MRCHFDKPFAVPAQAYKADDHTLLLVHFDGSTDLIGPGGETVSADFENEP